ncbi:MAG: pyridoxamine 5'-phosphate oxidase family protein [Limnohabitans sp.]|nr:pyridoxamine 5'-phosphate oxidase family protein [Limnohabitans sp.]
MEHIIQHTRIREILGTPNATTRQKIKGSLHAGMKRFIDASSLVMMASVDEMGFPTVSPKGDQSGFVRVQDDQTLLIPERKGNKLAFTLENLLKNPKLGLIFMVPGSDETLRVHGHARVLHDAALCKSMASASHDALLVIEVTVTQCYFHCAKAFLRSQAWRPESWGPKQSVSFGEEILGTSADVADAVNQLDSGVRGRYQTDL